MQTLANLLSLSSTLTALFSAYSKPLFIDLPTHIIPNLLQHVSCDVLKVAC